ncbi:hypothetical protein Tco_0015375 [Tanacetum coccineum]
MQCINADTNQHSVDQGQLTLVRRSGVWCEVKKSVIIDAVCTSAVSYSYDLKGCKRQAAKGLENDEPGYSFSTDKGPALVFEGEESMIAAMSGAKNALPT